MSFFSDEKRLAATRSILDYLRETLDTRFSVRLWDGSLIPLGREVDKNFVVAINRPSALGTMMRWPTLENLIHQYVSGYLEIQGDLIDFIALFREPQFRKNKKKLDKFFMLRKALPLLFAPLSNSRAQYEFEADAVGRQESRRDNKKFIQFHYDISNDFYALFLGKEMQYSCGYFTDADNSLDQAQHDKLEMICRKLRLQPDEKFLDIGCGWGGLVCHAAQHHGVKAHGVTLSQEQFDFATAKAKRLGLEDRITIELRDYSTLEGTYDKIASVGMYEHVGIDNMPRYISKISSLLRDRGMFLNHGVSRTAKASRRAARRIRPERRLLLKYIFPGSELDHVGHTTDLMEIHGFEVRDIEAWREHYGMTIKHWYRNLMARKKEAVDLVGIERFRIFALYLAGTSTGLRDGSIHICQVLAVKKASKGPSGLPLTRADLYRPGVTLLPGGGNG
jgi:cyclopropane-fatty-acyl-phospholipid synthase